MTQAGTISLRARMPEHNIRSIFSNKIPTDILNIFFYYIRILYLDSDLSVEEISKLISILSRNAELKQKTERFKVLVDKIEKNPNPDVLLRKLNSVILKSSRNCVLALKLNQLSHDLSSDRRKKLALYLCLILYFVK